MKPISEIRALFNVIKTETRRWFNTGARIDEVGQDILDHIEHLEQGAENLWELSEGNILQPKDDKTFTIKKAHEVDVADGNPDKYLNEKGDMAQVEAGQVKYTPSFFVGSENVQDAVTELGNNKQEMLESGTNIKTINGESILGGGDIEIQGGGSTYKILDTVVSTWTASTTYTKYPYEAVILIENLKESDSVEVIYSIPDAESTNYASGGELYDGYIKIFAKVNTTITIPTLVVTKIDL